MVRMFGKLLWWSAEAQLLLVTCLLAAGLFFGAVNSACGSAVMPLCSPVHFLLEFLLLISISDDKLSGLADENESVRDAVLGAGHVLVEHYTTTNDKFSFIGHQGLGNCLEQKNGEPMVSFIIEWASQQMKEWLHCSADACKMQWRKEYKSVLEN
ncbi:eIF-2-alpha kinase activator GCN1 [Trifolium repens]|nr:eIF-2-alpha kinase activator GCN1 [Trifolium repens]